MQQCLYYLKIQTSVSRVLSNDLSSATCTSSCGARDPVVCSISNHKVFYSQYHNFSVEVFVFLFFICTLFLCRINNCVGEDNHWLFLQLCFYTQILSSYTLILDFCHYYYFLPLKKENWVRTCFIMNK